MSQSLPVLRGAALGQCCCSIAVIDDVMGRLALLQSYFSLMSNPSPATPASSPERGATCTMSATDFPALRGKGRWTMLNIHVCYPVWKFAQCADPYRAAMDAIIAGGYDPDYEAALIQSVFDVAHAARYRTETIPLPPTVLGRNKAVDQLAVCHG